jgi:polar amino acid transport system substrate-binding protein
MIPVAIIAFSITFGCRVANVLNTGLNSVDRGEIEAAEAMGLSPLQIFTKIQFPQAVALTFGMFKTQTVTMIKNTSIVGYIAVMDLTKASDIIRARTYESFFSLVFTAVIYFLITRAALALLSQFGNRIDPRRRAKK